MYNVHNMHVTIHLHICNRYVHASKENMIVRIVAYTFYTALAYIQCTMIHYSHKSFVSVNWTMFYVTWCISPLDGLILLNHEGGEATLNTPPPTSYWAERIMLIPREKNKNKMGIPWLGGGSTVTYICALF